MDDLKTGAEVDPPRHRGAQSGALRNHNERAILSLLRSHGPQAKSEIAKALNLSAQTASVILRQLEDQSLVEKCAPLKGKVGKPQTPLALRANGAYAFGLRLGRRSADLVLVDLHGQIVGQQTMAYAYPTPVEIESFCQNGIATLSDSLPRGATKRFAGLGIAAPFELWNWLDTIGAPPEDANRWRGYDFETAFAAFTDMPVFVANDVNLACTGELLFGSGAPLRDFLYFYVGAFVGGAVVLNHRVLHGSHGNAGAFGSIPAGAPGNRNAQLIATCSLLPLENRLAAAHGDPVELRSDDTLWNGTDPLVTRWMQDAAEAMARAALSVVAALDVCDVVIDGALPAKARQRFVALLAEAASRLDSQGIHPPRFHEGGLGAQAGSLGAAYHPMLQQFFAEGAELTM